MVLCHGTQKIKGLRSSLTHEERKKIVVLSIGRENTCVRITDSILFLVYNVYRHPDFLKNLCHHLMTRGTDPRDARPDSAIGVFLTLYHQDLRSNPDQTIRLYTEKDRIQNLCLQSNFVNERIMARVSVDLAGNERFVAKNSRRSADREQIPRGIHLATTREVSPPYAYFDQRSRDLFVDVGLGLYRCDRPGEMSSVLTMTPTRPVSLETVCARIHNDSRDTTTNHLLLIACRGYAFPAYGNPFQSERGNLKRPRQERRQDESAPVKKKKKIN